MNPRYIRRPYVINKQAVFWISFVHVGALMAIPFFTWPAFYLFLFMTFVFSPIGVTLTYHRMLTHRAFSVPRWLEYFLATIGTFSGQGSPLEWVAKHRLHHRYSDTEFDYHTPRKGFFYSHIGHLLVITENEPTREEMKKYVPDLNRQSFYRFLDRNHLWISLSALPVLYLIGGLPFLFWGGFARVAVMLHITWLVNSATHTFGYRNFATSDDSKNCWWVSLLSAGEGWHNNHHADPTCAAHGRKWWEFDLTWMAIRGMAKVGLATQVKRPKPIVVEANTASGDSVENSDVWIQQNPYLSKIQDEYKGK